MTLLESLVPLIAAIISFVGLVTASGAIRKLPPWTATAVIVGIYIIGALAMGWASYSYFGHEAPILGEDQSFSDFMFKVATLYGAIFAGALALFRTLEVRRANNLTERSKTTDDLIKAIELLGENNPVSQIAAAQMLSKIAQNDHNHEETVKSALVARIDASHFRKRRAIFKNPAQIHDDHDAITDLITVGSALFGNENQAFTTTYYAVINSYVTDGMKNYRCRTAAIRDATFNDMVLKNTIFEDAHFFGENRFENVSFHNVRIELVGTEQIKDWSIHFDEHCSGTVNLSLTNEQLEDVKISPPRLQGLTIDAAWIADQVASAQLEPS
ncbi:hypothetical protein [Maritalea myrionectae]|uniref:hypothetical protein n=1 Tax=Maritalea myrionectae TaxID=454601 RepID=UPI00048029C9|nr:hypothetical protein [Maritalea myrionectae]